MKKIMACFALLLLFRAFAIAADKETLLTIASNAYQQKNYIVADSIYGLLLKTNPHNKYLLFDRANTCYKMEAYGKAVLYYEKALKEDPCYADAKKNLQATKLRTADKTEPSTEIILVKAWKKMTCALNIGSWTLISLISFWIVFAFALLLLFHKSILLKKRSLIALVFCVFISVFTGAIAFARNQTYQDHSHAIIMVDKSLLRISPDKNSNGSTILFNGEKIHILDQIGTWYNIETGEKKKGWVEEKVFERI